MYSRPRDRQTQPLQIPKNYSGCAFTAAPPHGQKEGTPPIRLPQEPEEVLSPECCNAPPEPPPPPPRPPAEDGPCDEKKHAHVVSPGLLGNLGLHFPFSQGFSFDEILILALMILLSHNESDPDILLFLGLLLFCG